MRHATIALVIAQPERIRSSLFTLLSTMPEIEIIAEAKNIAALQHAGEELQPDLILIEGGAKLSGLPQALSDFRHSWPNVRTIVLVETTEQRETAVAAGADVVLLKGFRPALLIQHIQALMPIKR